MSTVNPDFKPNSAFIKRKLVKILRYLIRSNQQWLKYGTSKLDRFQIFVIHVTKKVPFKKLVSFGDIQIYFGVPPNYLIDRG